MNSPRVEGLKMQAICLKLPLKKECRGPRNGNNEADVRKWLQEFEKQISDGKLDGMLATVFAQLQAQNPAAVAAASAARVSSWEYCRSRRSGSEFNRNLSCCNRK